VLFIEWFSDPLELMTALAAGISPRYETDA